MRNHTAMSVVAEIEYIDADHGRRRHADIGPRSGDLHAGLADQDFRQYLHDNLDEWLDESDGTGIFYISGDPDQFLKGPAHLDPIEESDTYAIEKVLNNRIDHLESEIDQIRRQMTSHARAHGAGGYWQKN